MDSLTSHVSIGKEGLNNTKKEYTQLSKRFHSPFSVATIKSGTFFVCSEEAEAGEILIKNHPSTLIFKNLSG